MARPRRIEFPGAIYHITSRGNGRKAIFTNDGDCLLFLASLAKVVERRKWICHAYCLMGNHYHLMVETTEANLSRGMQHLNSSYSQRFNRKHKQCGHVLQGRFFGLLIQREDHLLEVCRYVVLNPVRAGLVAAAGDYLWSSYRSTLGQCDADSWLCTDWVLSQFGTGRAEARAAYERFVSAGVGAPSPLLVKRGRLVIGSEDFVEEVEAALEDKLKSPEFPLDQRLAGRPSLSEIFARRSADKKHRNRHIHDAYWKHQYSMSAIGAYIGLHYSTISKILRSLH